MTDNTERDVEKAVSTEYFVQTLRRLADAIEPGESARIQVLGARVTIPATAKLSVEHEREDGEQELELQMRW